MQQQSEACQNVQHAVEMGVRKGGPRKQAHSNYAMAINDLIICESLKKPGLTQEKAKNAIEKIKGILLEDDQSGKGNLRKKVRSTLQNATTRLENWMHDGTAFDAVFLW